MEMLDPFWVLGNCHFGQKRLFRLKSRVLENGVSSKVVPGAANLPNQTFQELSCLRDSRDSQVTHYRSALRNGIPDSAEVSNLGSGTRLTFRHSDGTHGRSMRIYITQTADSWSGLYLYHSSHGVRYHPSSLCTFPEVLPPGVIDMCS
jgi:hypothetical protein